jgi:NAD-dependent dihydropyrimidine dehydrogenase PreA subunit
MIDYRYLKNGESLSVCDKSCVGCGACLEVCPHGVFELAGGIAAIKDRGSCMECGACARNCPAGAISVTPGVGCAAAIIAGKLTGTTPSCDCGGAGSSKAGPKKSCCG